MNQLMSQIIQSIRHASRLTRFITLVLVGMTMSGYASAANDEPSNNLASSNQELKIVATIKPIQLLINDIRGQKNAAEVLLKDNQNHHVTSLKPSQLKMVTDADIVFYIDQDFETFLTKIMRKDNEGRTRYVALGDTPGMRLLSIRESGQMPHTFVEGGNYYQGSYASQKTAISSFHAGHAGSAIDWHIWLSPDNAIVMLRAIRDVLIEVEPHKAQLYNKNFDRHADKLVNYSMQTAKRIKSVMYTPFFILHDGYQYFEEQYGLQAKATILRHRETTPSLRHLHTLKQTQKNKKVMIVLKDYQFSDHPIRALSADNNLQVINLDSLGLNLSEDTFSYIDFITSFTDDFFAGLSYKN